MCAGVEEGFAGVTTSYRITELCYAGEERYVGVGEDREVMLFFGRELGRDRASRMPWEFLFLAVTIC